MFSWAHTSLLVCFCDWWTRTRAHAEVGGHPGRVGSLLPPCGFQELSTDHQGWQQVPSHPHCHPFQTVSSQTELLILCHTFELPAPFQICSCHKAASWYSQCSVLGLLFQARRPGSFQGHSFLVNLLSFLTFFIDKHPLNLCAGYS